MDQPLPGARLIVGALPEAGSACRIEGEEAAHARARRVAAGDAVVLLDGSGREAAGRVTRIDRGFVEVDVERVRAAAPDPAAPIHLLVAAVRSERLSWIAEKATELGAARLTLCRVNGRRAFAQARRSARGWPGWFGRRPSRRRRLAGPRSSGRSRCLTCCEVRRQGRGSSST